MFSAKPYPEIYCYGHTNVTVLTTPSGVRQAFYQIESEQTKRTQWYPFDGIPPQMDVNVFAPYRRDFLAQHGNYGTPELQQMAQQLDSLNIQPASGEPRRRKNFSQWTDYREVTYI
jgi:hypothetical protein